MARAAKRLEIAKQAVVAAIAEQDRLQGEYNVGCARLEELKKEALVTPPPMEVDGNTDRNPTTRSHGFRAPQGKGQFAIAQRHVEASGRGCGRPHNFDPRSLGRVASVDHVHICEDVDGHGTRRFGVGGRVVSSISCRGTKLASAKRRCNNLGSVIVPSK